MNRTLSAKSLFVMAAFTLAAGAASANDQCFEDGLKAPWQAPAPSIELGHHHEMGEHGHHGFEFGGKHHFDMDGNGHGHPGMGMGVTPVPEPSTDAMLLAGLVMLVSLARRKSKSRSV